MFIDSIEKCGKYKYKIKSEGEVFFAYYSDLKKYGMKAGEELSEENYDSFIKETLIPRAKKKALDLLCKSDCSENDLRRKLLMKGYSAAIIESAVNYVKKFNYLNDERYAENYVRYRGGTKSSRQLKMDLFSKGIEADIVENILENDQSDEEAIDKLIRKKVRNLEDIDEVNLKKLYAYLYRKGFSTELISSKLKEVSACLE